jgi:hypothetical protein
MLAQLNTLVGIDGVPVEVEVDAANGPWMNDRHARRTPKGLDNTAQGCRTRLPWGAASPPRDYPEGVAPAL